MPDLESLGRELMDRPPPTELDARPASCGETAEQRERNGIECRRAIDAGQPVYRREVMIADDEGVPRRYRYQEK